MIVFTFLCALGGVDHQSGDETEALTFSASDNVDHLSWLGIFFSHFIFSSEAAKLKRRTLAESEITSKINDRVDRWVHLSNAQL